MHICPICNTELKQSFTSFYCPNNNCYLDLPTQIIMFDDGITTKYWLSIKGKLHREGDKLYHKDGKIWYEVYAENGLYHRIGNKPAHIAYDCDGFIYNEVYYENGIFIKDI